MKWLVGYIFDGWNGALFMLGETIDRAMDVWGDDDE
jgi:hypothetical protein